MIGAAAVIDAVTPPQAFSALRDGPDTVLVDVRSAPEWTFVGLPDLSSIAAAPWRIEWAAWPEMRPDPARFAAALARAVEAAPVPPRRLLFLCRSGVRSRAAAEWVADWAAARGPAIACININEGFEGDKDAHGHRGTANGWKARGLPWTQG